MNLPKWAWIAIGAVVVVIAFVVLLVVLAVTKANLQVGSNGIHATQGLVKPN